MMKDEDIRLNQMIETRQKIMSTFESDDEISVLIIQRKCFVEYNAASVTFRNLLEDGIIVENRERSKFIFNPH